MEHGSLIFARGVLYLIAFAALLVCFVLLPELVREEQVGKPINHFLTFAFFVVAYTIATPFFIALYSAHKLLNLIEKHKAFTKASLKTLQNIKVCALIFSVLVVMSVVAGISISKSIDPSEDVTFMVPIGFMFTFTSTVIAVFVAVLQKLMAEAISMKSENDLII